MSRRLTPEEKERLFQLFKTGKYTLKELADKFGITATGVSYILTQKLKR